MGGDAGQEALAGPGDERKDPQVKLIHLPAFEEGPAERAGAVLQQGAVTGLLDAGDRLDDVPLQDLGEAMELKSVGLSQVAVNTRSSRSVGPLT